MPATAIILAYMLMNEHAVGFHRTSLAFSTLTLTLLSPTSARLILCIPLVVCSHPALHPTALASSCRSFAFPVSFFWPPENCNESRPNHDRTDYHERAMTKKDCILTASPCFVATGIT